MTLSFPKWAEPASGYDYFSFSLENLGDAKMRKVHKLTMGCHRQKLMFKFRLLILRNKNAPGLDILQSYSHTYYQCWLARSLPLKKYFFLYVRKSAWVFFFGRPCRFIIQKKMVCIVLYCVKLSSCCCCCCSSYYCRLKIFFSC